MKTSFAAILIALALHTTGCVSQKEAQAQVQNAYQAGFEQGKAAAETARTHVFVNGPVQQQQIPWYPDLTVAQAIVEAVYTAPNDPASIVITRDGMTHPIDPENLLRGIDFPLEPGDQIRLIP